jgi:PleD family two-component response regulator
MLSQCRAYVVAQSGAQNRSLSHLAERAGFGFIGSVLGERRVSIEASRGDILFFLLHHALTDRTQTSVIRRIRECEDEAIRYAPIALVIPDCPYETVLKYVRMGYDDVITLPEKREALIGRLRGQLDTEQVYFETPDYLGPDRRRMEIAAHYRDERRTGDLAYTRLVVHRSIDKGVRILKREIFGRQVVTVPIPRPHYGSTVALAARA